MIPQKAIKKIKNDAHREIVVGHMLAYGFFPSTSEGIAEAKNFVAGLDQWVAPSDLPNYYNDLESDLMTGRETAGIINIRMILEQFYFGGGGQSEPEEIPVEMEIIEVEQKDSDEPIVVKVEAPFENPVNPGTPRRIRLPRVRNTIKKPKVTSNKKDTATRMAESFDRRLDDLLDKIKNPDPGAPPRLRKPKQVLLKKTKNVKVNTDVETDDPYKAKSFNQFLGLKLGNSFKRAAAARRIAKESGADPKERGYFLKKSLAFEFGGDKLSRMKGTFSKDPARVNDPALTRDQRFLAGIGDDITPPPVKQQELFDTTQYNNKTGIQKAFDSSIDKLKNSFSKVEKGLNDLINLKKNTPDNKEAFTGLSKTVDDLKSIFKKNNDLQENINTTKDKQLELSLESLEDAQSAAKEASMEDQKFRSATTGYDTPMDKSDQEDDEDGDDDGKRSPLDWLLDGMDLLDNIPGRRGGRKGRDGRTARERLRDQRKNKKNPLQRGKDWMGRQKDKVGGFFNRQKDRIGSGVKGLQDKGSDALKFLRGKGDDALQMGKSFGPRALNAGKGLADNVGGFFNRVGGRLLGAGSRFGARAVPLLGGVASGAEAKWRADQGDTVGAWLAGIGGGTSVAAAGSAATGIGVAAVPFIEAASMVADVGLFGYDVFNILTGREFKKPKEKLAEGGTVPAMIGEAGPEMLIRNGQPSSNPLQSLVPIIVATREVTKRAGTWADPIENLVRQTTDPIAKQLKLPVIPTNIGIGKGALQKPSETKDEGILGMLKGFLGMGGGKSGGKGKGSGNKDTKVPITGIPLGESETAKAGELVSGLVSRGFTKEEAAAIVGNLWAESGFRTGALNESSGAYGLMQWLGGRKTRLVQFAQEKGKSPADLDLQLDYIAWELKGGNPYETKQFEKAMAYGSSIADKTRGFAYEVERAGAGELASSMSKRVGAGESAFNASSQLQVRQEPPSPTANVPPQQANPVTNPLTLQSPAPASPPPAQKTNITMMPNLYQWPSANPSIPSQSGYSGSPPPTSYDSMLQSIRFTRLSQQ